MERIRLISDFRDFYDHHLHDGHDSPNIFRRVTTDGLDREEMLEYLIKLQFTVPKFGKLKEFDPEDLVVIYHNLRTHRGEGKELVKAKFAMDEFPDILASLYIPFETDENHYGIKGLSWRYLQVGMESFWLEYTSRNDWRSNCGDSNVKVIFRDKTELVPDHNYDLMLFKCPLFAIDFVPQGKNLYAIDFNIAPGCDPIKELMKPQEAAASIRKAYKLLKMLTDQ